MNNLITLLSNYSFPTAIILFMVVFAIFVLRVQIVEWTQYHRGKREALYKAELDQKKSMNEANLEKAKTDREEKRLWIMHAKNLATRYLGSNTTSWNADFTDELDYRAICQHFDAASRDFIENRSPNQYRARLEMFLSEIDRLAQEWELRH